MTSGLLAICIAVVATAFAVLAAAVWPPLRGRETFLTARSREALHRRVQRAWDSAAGPVRRAGAPLVPPARRAARGGADAAAAAGRGAHRAGEVARHALGSTVERLHGALAHRDAG